MTTVFNKIHRLKQQPGWTWDHFLSEIDKHFPSGVDEKTLYSHYRQPHKKPNAHLTRIIDHLHDQFFPNPFPEGINRLMRLYNNLVNCKKHLNQEKDIQDLEYFVCEQLEREASQELLHIARLNWLLGNIQFDRIPTHRESGRREHLDAVKRAAIVHYQNSVNAIEAYNLKHPKTPVGPSYLYKARHNILACYLNAVTQNQRAKDPEVIKYLKESNYISNSKESLSAEPYQWLIARNGLRFSSLLEDKHDVEYFFSKLTDISERFVDLNYEPLNATSIAKGKDFQWARDHVLTQPYLNRFSSTQGTS